MSRPVISDDARLSLTEVFINRMLTSAQYLKSAHDYKYWMKRKIQFFIKEGELSTICRTFHENCSAVRIEKLKTVGGVDEMKSSVFSFPSGLEKKLRVIFDDLLGPNLSNSTSDQTVCHSNLPKILVWL